MLTLFVSVRFNDISPMFTFNGIELRGTIIDGAPWFVAADACQCLRMDLSAGTSRWLRGLAADEKRRLSRNELPQNLCGSNVPSLNVVSEPGLYKLIQRSNKPEAKEFDRWVRHCRGSIPAVAHPVFVTGWAREPPTRPLPRSHSAPTASPGTHPAPGAGSPLHGRNNQRNDG